jgi:hypothetical protein
MSDFTNLENIYRIFKPAREIAAEKLTGGKTGGPSSIVSQLQELLINTGNGSYPIAEVKKQLESLITNATDDEKKKFNRWISFYSSEGFLDNQKAPRTYFDEQEKKLKELSFEQISGVKKEEFTSRPMSICQVRNGFISPATRDASKVEMFLNFMPSMMLTQCIPYMELEFVFDRPFGTDNTLSTPSLLKFLMGGATVSADENNPNTVMYRSAYGTSGKAETDEDGNQVDNRRVQTSAGMELFTSPQTLINLDPVADGLRYVPVLDPMRPFMTLENVTIDIKGTTGVMCHKTAQLAIKLHDRSRLSELADMIQPAAYGRATVWLTYGWRFPNASADTSGTYAEFVNHSMLMKEAFGIVNSSFTFEQNGQVSLTLGLFTKNAAEMRRATLQDDARFLKLKRQQEQLSEEIARIQRVHKIAPPAGEPKEIRPYVVLGSASSGAYPDLKGPEVEAAIKKLVSALERRPAAPKGAAKAQSHIPSAEAKRLGERLRDYYFGPQKERNRRVFYFKKQFENLADQVVREKWDALSSSPDPFIVDTQEKNDLLLTEDMGYARGIKYPYLDQIKTYNKSNMVQTASKITKGIQKKTVSFGKLFSVFMVPALLNLESVEECQVYFYNFNDLACLAAGTNISEFAIDLPEFLIRYKETIANNASTNMTVENFIQLAVNAQVRDLRAIPYGFRHEKGLLTPWGDKDHPQAAVKEKQEVNFGSLAMSFNSGRGGFQQPEIEVLLEVSFKRTSDTGGAGDLLKRYHDSDAIRMPHGSTSDRILKVHVYDKGANPYRKVTNFLKTQDGSKFIETYDPFDPYLRNQQSEIDFTSMAGETQNSKESDGKVESQITELANSGRVQAEYMTTTGGKGDWDTVKRYVSRKIPTLIPGSNGSAILDVSMATNSDPKLASIQMIGMGKSDSVTSTPRGSGPGNLPLRVIPAQLSMRTMGIPIVGFTQMFFVDMNTGTSIDNVYGVSGITHTFSPGKFESNLNFAFYDSYGVYESAPTVLDQIKDTVEKLEATEQNNKQK